MNQRLEGRGTTPLISFIIPYLYQICTTVLISTIAQIHTVVISSSAILKG
jgi:hypothetical protein